MTKDMIEKLSERLYLLKPGEKRLGYLQ
jgi:hypothetical protein